MVLMMVIITMTATGESNATGTQHMESQLLLWLLTLSAKVIDYLDYLGILTNHTFLFQENFAMTHQLLQPILTS